MDPAMPCHVYLTLAENATSSVFVNMHMPPSTKAGTKVRVYANCEPASLVGSSLQTCYSGRAASAKEFSHDYLKEGARDVYSAFIAGLEADTHYNLVIEVAGKNLSSLPHWRFRTAPQPGQDVELVFGGDMGSSSHVSRLMAISLGTQASTWPAAVVIGGDIAYDNGMPTCWSVWEDWFDRWDTAMANAQRMVPLVFAVGNHDVGIEAIADMSPPQVNKERLPFFSYFPHHSVKGGVPDLLHRAPYHVHRIGHTLVLSLDSGYVVTSNAESKQLKWAANIMQTDAKSPVPAITVFPTYHVPIYASSKKHYHEWGAGPSGAFVPLFDAYGVGIAFENHVHAFKRTVPMRDSKFHPNGTVYLGDGRAGLHGLGVPSQTALVQRSEEPRFQVNCLAREHVWQVKVTRDETFVKAVDRRRGI